MKVIVAVVAILIVLFFFSRGEKYDIGELKTLFEKDKVSISDQNTLITLIDKTAAGNQLTTKETGVASDITSKYPDLEQNIGIILASSAPSSTPSGVMKTPQYIMQKMGMSKPIMQKMGMAPPRKFTCTFDR